MRPTRFRPTFFVAVVLTAVSCTPARHNDDLGPIPGSAERLRPTIASASTTSRDQVVTFTIPERSYVSVLDVLTQSSLTILGTAPVGGPTAVEPMDAGKHKLVLTSSPVRIGANVRRSARPLNDGDPRLAPTDTPYQRTRYTVVVTTATPMTLTDLQQSLETVDLTGPDDAVLQRVAEAVGGHSLGHWGASAVRVAQQAAVF